MFNKELYNQTVIPDPDPVSPAHINEWRSRIPRKGSLGKVRDDTLFGQPQKIKVPLFPQGIPSGEGGSDPPAGGELEDDYLSIELP